MNPDLQKVIDKIAKLRALSQSDNVNEAAAAAAAAERLIQEHRLSEADVEASSPSTPHEAPEQAPGHLFETGKKLPAWQWRLASGLGRQYGIAFWLDSDRIVVKSLEHPLGKQEYVQRLRMVGRRSDVEITRYQYAYLSLEITRLTSAFLKDNTFDRGEGRTAANSFRLGAVWGVLDAMYLENKRAQEVAKVAGSTGAMVLVNRGAEAKAMMAKLQPNLRTQGGKSNSRIDDDAFVAGKAAGSNIRQHASMGGSATRALKK